MAKKYTSISIPNELLKQIDSEIEKGLLGYKSRSEFIKEALRKHLAEMIKLRLEKERRK